MPNRLEGLEIVEGAGRSEFNVKVVPGASRTHIAGLLGSALKVTVAAPPEGGRANAALVGCLAQQLGVKKGQVEVIAGLTRPLKRVRVNGLTATDVRQRLTAAGSA